MNRIKQLRQARNLTQDELAEQAGVPQQYISDLENGRIKAPSLPRGLRLAAALGVSPDELTTPDAPAQLAVSAI